MTLAAVRGQNCMRTPTLGSILLASTDPDRLRAWYERAFAARPNPDGFLEFGGVAVLIDHRDDIAASCVEPGRVILNLHVDDARAAAAHLATLGVRWVAELELRGDAWFAALLDPDGNCVQIIELTDAYWAARGRSSALSRAKVSGRLPAQDLERARRFYADALGLEPVEERPGGLRYEGAAGSFALFASAGRPSGEHTQLAFEVDDIEATVRELRERGVRFEEVDVPGMITVDGIAEVDGNYPSSGTTGERAAWFRDSEGNLLGIGQPVRG
jgi:catechol 2,3-dioxygenase-like lactoylglutathione lyase family enzyme